MTAFNKRKDKYWFEKTSRKYADKNIVDFLVSNFVTANNPSSLWIGEIINSGERTYSEWSRKQQSLTQENQQYFCQHIFLMSFQTNTYLSFY